MESFNFHVSRLAWKHEKGLQSISSNVETMKHIGHGRAWSASHVKTTIRQGVDDAARMSTRYQHFAFIHNDEVVGYARFVCKRVSGGEFVIRVFCRPNEMGYGTMGMKACMNIVRESIGESLPCALFVAEVHDDNTRGMNFFKKKLGFVRAGRGHHGMRYILPMYPDHYVACRGKISEKCVV